MFNIPGYVTKPNTGGVSSALAVLIPKATRTTTFNIQYIIKQGDNAFIRTYLILNIKN